jgi:hypothetical protein
MGSAITVRYTQGICVAVLMLSTSHRNLYIGVTCGSFNLCFRASQVLPGMGLEWFQILLGFGRRGPICVAMQPPLIRLIHQTAIHSCSS